MHILSPMLMPMPRLPSYWTDVPLALVALLTGRTVWCCVVDLSVVWRPKESTSWRLLHITVHTRYRNSSSILCCICISPVLSRGRYGRVRHTSWSIRQINGRHRVRHPVCTVLYSIAQYLPCAHTAARHYSYPNCTVQISSYSPPLTIKCFISIWPVLRANTSLPSEYTPIARVILPRIAPNSSPLSPPLCD
jgi:hypothetical protein